MLALASALVLGACSSTRAAPAAPVPVPARAALSVEPSSVERTVTVHGARRTYLAVGPARKPGLPLLVVLHGRGVTARQESVRTGFLAYAERGLADLVYPQGTDDSWNDGHGCCGRAGAMGVDDTRFVTDVVADASRFFGSDPRRVYLAGYSNGARLAFVEVCGHPTLFAAFATYGALPPAACPGGPALPVLIGAGTNDSLVRGEGSVTDVVARWRTRDGCGPQATTEHTGPLTLTTWTGCRAGSAVASALYTGVGHYWPTVGPNQGPFTQPVGTQAAAATVMWNFLTSHARIG